MKRLFLVCGALALLLSTPALASLPAPANLEVVEHGDGWARLRWERVVDPAVKGYRILYSYAPGDHPSMPDWNGHEAAFTFTTDDGKADNLLWMRIFDRHERSFTAFTIPERLGWSGFLTPAEVETLDAHGHEVASHTYSHPALIRNTAFTIAYTGSTGVCTFEIAADSLRTHFGGGVRDLEFDLADPAVEFLAALVESIDARPAYTCVLDYYDCTNEYCQSIYLEETSGKRIDDAPYQALTTMGCDSVTLVQELTVSRRFLEELIPDTAYRCRSLAYPRHAHDQREMNAAMETGYLGARDGPISGTYPCCAPVSYSYLDRVNLFQDPVAWGKPPNDSGETYCRSWMQNRIAEWKQGGEWATWMAHDVADWDSAHVEWALEELEADSGVWVAPFGDVAEYVHRYHVTVEDPADLWNDSLTATAPLHGLQAGPTVYAVVVAYDTNDVASPWSNEVSFQAVALPTEVDGGGPGVPPLFHLGPVRPNPMNPSVEIPIEIDRAGPVTLAVYDPRGRLLRVLLDEVLPAGSRRVSWNGTDRADRPAPPGLYFCRIETPWGNGAEKIVLLR